MGPVAAALLLTACATAPSGPSVMSLPGRGKSIEQFQSDDVACRELAARQIGTAQGGSLGDGGVPLQRRYDVAYMQCMYAKGHQVPVAGGSQGYVSPSSPSTSAPAAGSLPPGVPPPPAGAPPPPPPGLERR